MEKREVDPGWQEGALWAAQGLAFLACESVKSLGLGWASQAGDE